MHHRFLGRVQGAARLGEVFDRPQGQAVHRVRQPDAAVDRPIAQAGAFDCGTHHRAGAAIALAAAFLGAAGAEVFAQDL